MNVYKCLNDNCPRSGIETYIENNGQCHKCLCIMAFIGIDSFKPEMAEGPEEEKDGEVC